MSLTERDLESYGEQFIVGIEAIGRSLKLYPANHPTVAAQCQRLIDAFADLRERDSQAVINFVNAELYVNGVPLKRLSLDYQKEIAGWEHKGIGLITFDEALEPSSITAFYEVMSKDRKELAAAGGLSKALDAAGVRGITAGRVAVGVQADTVSMVDGDVADAPMVEAQEQDLETVKGSYRDAFNRLLVAVQWGASADPRVRMTRNLSQVVESRLLQRRAVRALAAKLREHDKESYRHALGGAVSAVVIGAALDVGPRRLVQLGEAALLRDIGKLKLNREALWGRDQSPENRAEYERHPELGAKLLMGDREIDPLAAIVAHEHHAMLDLSGFPKLVARRSPHAATRIVTVASDYDRLTGGYPGVPMHSVWEAVSKIIQGVGTLYDPAAVRAFLSVMGSVPEGTPVKLCDGREGIVAGPGTKSWLCPEVAVLRDADGNDVEPQVVATDGLVPPGESVIHSFLTVTDAQRERLEALRDVE